MNMFISKGIRNNKCVSCKRRGNKDNGAKFKLTQCAVCLQALIFKHVDDVYPYDPTTYMSYLIFFNNYIN